MGTGTLVLRLAVGGLLAGHGLQKLRGAFGGPGIDGATGMMQAIGMRPARANAVAVSWVETAGGAALVAGLATPAAAGALIASQAVAVAKVHGKKGAWNSGGGWEYNAVLIAALTAVAAEGPGALSLDGLVGRSRWGAGWGLLALGGGIAGAWGVLESSRRLLAAETVEPGGDDAESADASI